MSESKIRRIVVVIREESKDMDRGYIPCGVEEGTLGYRPFSGNGECASPWNWGPNRKIAQNIADEQNKKMGYSEEDVQEVVHRWDPTGDINVNKY